MTTSEDLARATGQLEMLLDRRCPGWRDGHPARSLVERLQRIETLASPEFRARATVLRREMEIER